MRGLNKLGLHLKQKGNEATVVDVNMTDGVHGGLVVHHLIPGENLVFYDKKYPPM